MALPVGIEWINFISKIAFHLQNSNIVLGSVNFQAIKRFELVDSPGSGCNEVRSRASFRRVVQISEIERLLSRCIFLLPVLVGPWQEAVFVPLSAL